jgi:uncharacterized repeat protein (TIGR03803 family)
MSRPVLARAALIAAAALLPIAPQAVAATVNRKPATVLYNFQGYPNDGSDPAGSLTFGPGGTLIGTTVYGGPSNGGTVFQLTPPANGQTNWTETLLHSFSGSDGAFPAETLITDASGNLYGVAQIGGANSLGVVYELSPPSTGGSWTFTLLYSFAGPDGATPYARLVMDNAGNLYGVTADGGTAWTSGSFTGQGVVYELSPPNFGQTGWTETVLHDFSGADGQNPIGGLALDDSGKLYGTTSGGGNCCGTVYELAPPTNTQTGWTETLIHNFAGRDGYTPSSSLSIDAAGNLYSTTLYDGRHGDGVVFKLAPPARGKTVWPMTMIHDFGGEFGANPSGDLTLDGAGDVYMTTPNGGLNAVGAVFEFSPRAGGGGNWTTTVFLGGTAAGTSPAAGVIRDASGNLYGVATTGGSAGHGTVFELAP